jgi:DNA-binding response OmpR family regulator
VAQLLVVSPDATLRKAVQRCARSLGHETLASSNAAEARKTLSRVSVAVLCLDSVLSDDDAGSVYALASSRPDRDPLRLVYLCPPSAQLVRSSVHASFRHRIDAFLTKPLSPARAARELRRLLEEGAVPETRDGLEVGGVTLDSGTNVLRVAGREPVSLTPIEYRLLRCMMERPGEYITKPDLLERVWGYPPDGGAELVRAHISNVRRKLRQIGQDELLRTMPYHGYGIVPQ